MFTDVTEMFTCGKCGERKVSSQFYWSSGRRSGYCKPCQQGYVTSQRRERGRASSRMRMYGLTPDGYRKRLEEQGYGCAICGAPHSEDTPLFVDHDHVNGEIRGLLCRRCNSMLGQFHDDFSLLEKAANYVWKGISIGEASTIAPAAPLPRLTAKLDAEVVAPAAPVSAPADEEDFLALAGEVDRMPGVDASDRAHDPLFRDRRVAQVALVQRMWKHLFHEELISPNAKALLALSGDYVEDLWMEMLRISARKPQHPLTYLKTVLRREREEQANPSPVSRSMSHSSENETNGGNDNYYRPPSAEYLAKIEKLRQRGLMVPDED